MIAEVFMDNVKRFHFRQYSLLLFAVVQLFVIVLGFAGMGFYVAYKENNELLLTWLLILISVFSFVYIFTAAMLMMVFGRIQRRLFTSISHFVDAFPEDERSALMLLCENDDAMLSAKASEWLKAKQLEIERLHITNDANVQAAAFINEIFWEKGTKREYVKHGDYWKKTYGSKALENADRIESLLTRETLESFNKAVAETTRNVGKNFFITGFMDVAPHRTIRVKIFGSSLKSFNQIIVFGIVRDIEQVRSLRERVFEEKAKNSFLAEAAAYAVYEVDVTENTLTVLNPEKARALNMFDLGNFEDERRPYWDYIHPDFREGFIDRFFNYDHLLMLPNHRLSYEYQVRNKLGDWIWVRHSVAATKTDLNQQHVLAVIGSIADINAQKREELKELYMPRYDSLTGVYLKSAVRRKFNDFVALNPDAPVAFVLFRINNYSQISEFYGRATVNKAMCKFVSVLWEKQSGKCTVGRIQDDTFISVMFKPFEGERTPSFMINRIFEVFSQQISLDCTSINMSLSVGYSVFPRDGKTFDEVFRAASIALEVSLSNNVAVDNLSTEYSDEFEKMYPFIAEKVDASDEEEK